MTTLAPLSDNLHDYDATAVVLGVIGDGEVTTHAQLPDEVRDALTTAAAPLEPKSKVGAITVLTHPDVSAARIVLVGVGDGTDAELREAAGAAARACGTKPAKVLLGLPTLTDSAVQAVSEGALLGAYTFTDYKSAEADSDFEGTDWLVAGATDAALDRAKVVAGAVAGTRDLVNTAPLDLFPGSFAEAAVGYAEQADGVEAKVWDVNDLAEQGFGGILAVGMGSSRLPRLVRVAYSPKGAKRTVALVGKGITFDSGGLSLKPPTSMETMKSDMAGAAAVLHTVLAAARAKLDVAVTGWLCLAENLPSGTAQRPSDVIRIYGGKSVEVLNTDAEGRLVLADGLVRALEEKPDVVLDVATLTGAQGLALGARTSGVMGVPAVRDAVVAAADSVGEPMWPMPLPEHLRESLDSKIADLKNIGDRNGGMLSAGLFLREFVGDAQWAHLDIARPAFNEGAAWGFTTPGGTGASVRTLLAYLESQQG